MKYCLSLICNFLIGRFRDGYKDVEDNEQSRYSKKNNWTFTKKLFKQTEDLPAIFALFDTLQILCFKINNIILSLLLDTLIQL